MVEARNHTIFASFKEKYQKDSANIHIWAFMYKTYPTVSKFVVQELIPFTATWLCETGLMQCAYRKRNIKSGRKLKLTCGCA